MRPSQAIRISLRKSFSYSGRASRAEFWWFAPLWLALAYLVSNALLPTPTSKNLLLTNFVLRVALCLPALGAASRRAIDAGIGENWVGWGFSAIFFGIGLLEIPLIAPSSAPTAWTAPTAITLIVGGLLMLTFVLSRPSQPDPNSYEVPQ